jgi:tRNA dimethylallyltransferase
MKKTVIFIVGPTSSGKTAVSVELAKLVDGEIISCDSMQVYKDMDVLTHAPHESEARGIRHHLVRIIPPEEEYSAARFIEDAGRAITDIFSRGRQPIVTGGTGLYMRSLIDGLLSGPSKDEGLRESLRKEAEEKGGEFLHGKLREVDPGTAAKLHANDLKRIIRALEVYHLGGKTLGQKHQEECSGIGALYDVRIFGLDVERPALYERVNGAVDKMLEGGLVDKVRELSLRKLSMTAAKAIGIKEMSAYLCGTLDMCAAANDMKMNTRRYAKRQLTWLRGEKRVEWVNAERSPAEIAREIERKVHDKT